jgi:hypothetical protein
MRSTCFDNNEDNGGKFRLFPYIMPSLGEWEKARGSFTCSTLTEEEEQEVKSSKLKGRSSGKTTVGTV